MPVYRLSGVSLLRVDELCYHSRAEFLWLCKCYLCYITTAI